MWSLEDCPVVQRLQKDVDLWTSRANMARESGNKELLRKALKHQKRYEHQLAHITQIVAQAEIEHQLYWETFRQRMLEPFHQVQKSASEFWSSLRRQR